MWKEQAVELAKTGLSWRKVAKSIGVPRSTTSDYLRTVFKGDKEEEDTKAKVLVLDIESAPITSHVWSLWNNNVGLNQIVGDWHLLSWAAKWLGAPEEDVFYMDQRHAPSVENDKFICQALAMLINEADFVVAQNGRKFDMKKINARMILNGLPPLKPVRIIDTLEIAKRDFGFTSNKLEYMTDKLCTKYKKLKHGKFPGHTLWTEVLKGNKEAWEEMRVYNIHDILSLEELYMKLRTWSTLHPAMAIFSKSKKLNCRICGSSDIEQEGYWYTNLSKYPLYHCKCGAWSRGRKTSTTKEERDLFTSSPL